MRTLVIDVGTSGLRAGIVNDDASVTNLHHVRFPASTPAPGLVEFDAGAMLAEVVRVAGLACGGERVDAVGITNQRASTVAWRRTTGIPVGPAIGWQDLRTVGECISARATHGFALAPNQSATKIAWLREHALSPDERASGDILFGTVESWIVWSLTRGAAHVTDHTNAAVTGLAVAEGTGWDDRILGALGIDAASLPRIVPSIGFVAEAPLLPGAPPVTALVGDQQASLVGQGCITPGATKITFGTGGMLDMFTGPRPPEAARRSSTGVFPIVAYSDAGSARYGVEGVMLSAGSCIEWLRDDMGLIDTPADSDALAGSVPSTEGVVFVPALFGLGTPRWDYGARGTLCGITRGTTRAHVVRAVLEGVAHRGVDLCEAAEAETSMKVAELRIDGGMSRNSTFVQALADASGLPVTVSGLTEATTLGAGLLAGTAAGQWSGLDEACGRVPRGRPVEPLGEPGISRQQWAEAVTRATSWMPGLSALDF